MCILIGGFCVLPKKLEATIKEAYQKCVVRGALSEVDCQRWIVRSELQEVLMLIGSCSDEGYKI